MKKLNSWPTFPQIIIKGELVGGLDILKEMIQHNGKEKTELDELLGN
jgi:glutaredoxin-related protein